MKRLSILIFVVVALAQLSVPASIAWMRSQTLKHGRVWKFKTAPIDPVDAIRGRYVALRFENEDFPVGTNPNFSGDVFVALKEDANGFATIDRISAEPISGENVVRAQSNGWWDGKEHVVFPFHKLWLAEDIAPAAEAAYMNNSTRKNQNAFVTVRVRNGDAALEQLYIGEKPLAEYLRETAKP